MGAKQPAAALRAHRQTDSRASQRQILATHHKRLLEVFG